MLLHLVRHGDAVPGHDDSARPLSAAGRAEVARLADRAAAAGVAVLEIRHSGLVRARQTAEILAEKLAPRGGVVVMSRTTPDDDPDIAAAEFDALDVPVLLVSHMPFLAELAERLAGSRGGGGGFRTSEMRTFDRTDGPPGAPIPRLWTAAATIDGK